MEIKYKSDKSISLKRPDLVAQILHDILKAEDELDRMKEHLWVIGVNKKLTIKTIDLLSLGGMASAPVDMKNLFQLLLERRCTAFILAHNHPDGSIEFSDDDETVTKKVARAAKYLDMQILDHIVVNETSYKSMKETGMMWGLYA